MKRMTAFSVVLDVGTQRLKLKEKRKTATRYTAR